MDICFETVRDYCNLSGGTIEPVQGTLYMRIVTDRYTMLIRPVIYGYGWELTDIYGKDIVPIPNQEDPSLPEGEEKWNSQVCGSNELYSYRYDYGELSCHVSREDEGKVKHLLVLLKKMRERTAGMRRRLCP